MKFYADQRAPDNVVHPSKETNDHAGDISGTDTTKLLLFCISLFPNFCIEL
jgi:hypothetical protein